MKLAVFNGSPRKTKSNSTLLMQHFLNGFYDTTDHHTELHYLADTSKTKQHVEAFAKADTALIVLPLYTDAMPGQVKFFLEKLEALESKGKQVGFIIQSGFPEAYHSQFLERYFEKLTRKMGWKYLGTVIRGGVEGIQIMPPSMTRKLFSRFEEMGNHFALFGQFKPELVRKLRSPYRLSRLRRLFFRLFMASGMTNYYWDRKLKENGAFENRFAKPYASEHN